MVKANRNEPLTPTFAVSLSAPGQKPNDETIAWDLLPWISSVSVMDYVDRPSTFTLDLVSREDENGTTIWSDDERFALGTSVAVKFGYGSEIETVIVGEITLLTPSFSIDSAPSLSVHGEDLRHRLDTVPRIRPPYTGRKYGEIVDAVCNDAKIHVNFGDTPIKGFAEQYNETDFSFLRSLAGEINYELAMRGRTLMFQPVKTNEESIATLTLDDDLLAFSPSMELPVATQIDVPGWDSVNKKPLIASFPRSDSGGPSMGGKRTAAEEAFRVLGKSVALTWVPEVSSEEELERIAAARYEQMALKFITGSGRCRGRTDIRAGEILSIRGVGTRFSGEYYVQTASHAYERGGGYVTHFTIRRNAS